MHTESQELMRAALAEHGRDLVPGVVLDVGAGGPHDAYRRIWEDAGWSYRGCDLAPGPQVHHIIENPARFPFRTGRFDAVISGQMLEHDPLFWITFLEMARVLKPGGLMVHIAPSRGREHPAPVDCWRFYRDGMAALAEWAGMDLLSATTDWRSEDIRHYRFRRPERARAMQATAVHTDTEWGDTVGVFRKPVRTRPGGASRYLSRDVSAGLRLPRLQQLLQPIIRT